MIKAQAPRVPPFADLTIRIVITIALLIPCLWQSRIQAGDFSSHVYNAWLAREINSGAVAVKGVSVVPQWTNVLTDWALQWLIGVVGVSAAQRIVAETSVLIFFWGAFYLMQVVSGRRPWLFCPILGVLCYGLVFHFGFLNFYLSTGFCFWILGLLWQFSWARAIGAVPLTILAVLAHPVPVAWAYSVFGYLYVARQLPKQWRILMPIVGLGALVLLQIVIMNSFVHRWSLDQLAGATGIAGLMGIDQVWLYDSKYLIVVGGLLLLWAALFIERLDRGGFFTDATAQIWFLHLAAFVLMPAAIQLPQYLHPLAYIPERLSLFTAIAFCMMVCGANYGRGMTRLSALVAAAFFIFLFLDDRAINDAEDEVSSLFATLPPGQRAVASIADPDTRLNPLMHVADRACIGHCFSYGDYEPATGQFRIRVSGPNPIVAPNMAVAQEIEAGRHIVTAGEAPLYSICTCEKGEGRFCLLRLKAGEQTCGVTIPMLPRLWSGSGFSAIVLTPGSKPPAPHTNN